MIRLAAGRVARGWGHLAKYEGGAGHFGEFVT